jgi:hypothetical protein
VRGQRMPAVTLAATIAPRRIVLARSNREQRIVA